MNKLRFMVLTCFIAAFGAGLLVGVVWARREQAALNSAVIAPPVNVVIEPPPAQVTPPTPPENPPPAKTETRRPPSHDDWLAELNLTKEQRDKMRQIWSEVMKQGSSNRREKEQTIRNEKDEAIKNLFTEEQRANYEGILKSAETKFAELGQEGKAVHERAVEQTREMLTPEQRVKYDELRKKREQWHRGGRDGRDGRENRDGKDGRSERKGPR